MAHSLVRHYFGTRDELLAEAFDLAAQSDQPTLAPPPGDDATHFNGPSAVLIAPNGEIWVAESEALEPPASTNATVITSAHAGK